MKYLYSFLNIKDQYDAGNIDYQRFEAFEKDLVGCLLSPGLSEWWGIVGKTHFELSGYIDELIARFSGEVTPYTDFMPGWKDEG